MLPKKNRLTVAEFNKLLLKSKDLNSDYFLIKVKQNGGSSPKIVIVVPKYLDKRSSYRHKTNRIINEALRSEIKNAKTPVSILVRAKKILNTGNTQFASAQIRAFLKKIIYDK